MCRNRRHVDTRIVLRFNISERASQHPNSTYNDHIELAKGAQRKVDDRLPVRRIRHAPLKSDDRTRRRSESTIDRLREVEDDDFGAFGDHPLDDGEAEAIRAC